MRFVGGIGPGIAPAAAVAGEVLAAVGAAVGIAMIAFNGHKREVPIPFGPYLAGGGLAAIFFGDALQSLWNL